MLGLVDYDSDEDGENTRTESSHVKTFSSTQISSASEVQNTEDIGSTTSVHNGLAPELPRSQTPDINVSDTNAKPEALIGPIIGPMVGPFSPSVASLEPARGSSSRPSSPYSASRAMIRDLTLPPVPNLDIPPSPPGSPPPSATAKLAHFLELKKQGVHFNEKLSKSSALKNPSLLQKLMSFAGIDEKQQYASTLPKEIWDPEAFPSWAYKEELARSQQEISKQIEEEKAKELRDAIDFVAATPSGDSSRGGTPGISGSGRGLGRSAAERVMAGLDRERTRSPLVQDGGKRREAERRGGKLRDRSRSRSRDRRKRTRSRSRSRDRRHDGRNTRIREYDRRH